MRKLLPVLAFALFPTVVSAVELSFQFTGSLTSITDQYGFLNGQFAAGDQIIGTLTYETNTPEDSTTIGNPTVAIYSAVTQFRVSVNGYFFEGSLGSLPGYLQIWDDRMVPPSVVDAITFSSPLDYSPPIPGMGSGTVVGSVDVNLFDFTATASANGVAIPQTIDVAKYGSTVFSALQLNVDTNEAFFLNGNISSISPIPEVGSGILLLFGLPAILAVRIKRKEA